MKRAAVLLVLAAITAITAQDSDTNDWCRSDPSTEPICIKFAHLAVSKQTGGATHYYTVLKLLKETTWNGGTNGFEFTVTFEAAPSTCAIADGPYSRELCKPKTDKACATCSATFYQPFAPVPPLFEHLWCHK
ncbi:hypothetical protein MTO96_050444 [Rhipicephalus appendiculatus]